MWHGTWLFYKFTFISSVLSSLKSLAVWNIFSQDIMVGAAAADVADADDGPSFGRRRAVLTQRGARHVWQNCTVDLAQITQRCRIRLPVELEVGCCTIGWGTVMFSRWARSLSWFQKHLRYRIRLIAWGIGIAIGAEVAAAGYTSLLVVVAVGYTYMHVLYIYVYIAQQKRRHELRCIIHATSRSLTASSLTRSRFFVRVAFFSGEACPFTIWFSSSSFI